MPSAVANFPSAADADVIPWKRTAALVCSVLLGLIFLVSGGWKVLDPFRTGELLEQAKVPGGWGAIGAATLGSLELLAAFLLFLPRYRKWGGYLGSALIIFFVGWVGFYYKSLAGQECSCFPIIKRTIGPGFFAGDGIMLLFGIAAITWSAKVLSVRVPAILLACVAVLGLSNFALQASRHTGLAAPSPIVVDGKTQSLKEGKIFLFFYDPSCMHCDKAAKFMSKLDWAESKVIAIPTVDPKFAADFLRDTHLKAGTSLESDKLRQTFKFVDPPFGVALVDGYQKQSFGVSAFEPPAPQGDLKKLGFVR